MKIQAKNLNDFIRNNYSKKSVLFYGPNKIDTENRVHEFLAYRKEFEILRLEYDEIKKDLSKLYSYTTNLDLFANEKILVINFNNPILSKDFKNFLSSEFVIQIICLAGDLSSKSELRKIYEKEDKFASIGCYPRSQIELENYVVELLQKNKIIFNSSDVKLICSLAGTENEINQAINKLSIFLESVSNKKIGKELIENFFSGNCEIKIEDFCKTFSLKNVQDIIKSYESLEYQKINIITILRYLINYYFRILEFKSLVKDKGEEVAFRSLSPPIFFYEQNHFRKLNMILSEKEISSMIDILVKLEIYSKTTGNKISIVFDLFLQHADDIGNFNDFTDELKLAI